MDRRRFLITGSSLLAAACVPALADGSGAFQYSLLRLGDQWEDRRRALVKLSFEVQKRCNIPIETTPKIINMGQIAKVNSPFFVISGGSAFQQPGQGDARAMRLVLNSGGVLLFDDTSAAGDTAFYQAALTFMRKVYPELEGPLPLPRDHAVYQSYYLLKEPRGRLNKRDYLEGWTMGGRTRAFFSHNDLLGAMEADQLGSWRYNMEIGGGFRRELCFRLGINMTYYTLTLNYKKDRAFPPIIERRRRI